MIILIYCKPLFAFTDNNSAISALVYEGFFSLIWQISFFCNPVNEVLMRLGVSMTVLKFLAEILLRGMVIIKKLAEL